MNAVVRRWLRRALALLKRLWKYSPFVIRPAARLIARKQLVALGTDQPWHWQATGDGPQFVIRRGLPLPGWHMLEVAMEHDQPNATVNVFWDTSNDFRREHSACLPVKRGQTSKRLCYIPGRLKALRINPMETEGCFTLRHLHLVWLSPGFAYNRLARRLVAKHDDWLGIDRARVMPALKRQAREQGVHWRDLALRQYNATFERHVLLSYSEWLYRSRELSAEEVQRIMDMLPSKPLISVVVSVFNPKVRWLRECLESVLAQHYPHWELCIADGVSANTEVHALLAEYAERDSRVHVAYEAGSGEIGATGNSALALAQGEFVAFLEHEDCLSRYALFRMAEALDRRADAGLLYSDEDRVDSSGVRFEPSFKPQWNPDLLLARNYIAHLAVYRTMLVREAGGFREGFDDCRHHDLALRISSCLTPEQIVHIPHVLYHGRAGERAAALDSETTDDLFQSGLIAVRESVQHRLPDAQVETGHHRRIYRVRWPLPEPAPLVSLLVPTRDRVEILRPCLDAILERTDYPNFEVLILDNQSSDSETLAYMRSVAQRDLRVRVLRWDQSFNFSAINNFGVRQAAGEIIGLLNNDVEPINSDWLAEMVRQVCRPEIGCVGAKLYYADDTVQHGGVILGLGGVAGHAHRFFQRNAAGYRHRLQVAHNLSAVTAACLLVRKSVFEAAGCLNEEALPVAYNDVDLCLKVRDAGYWNLWTPYAELYHYESVSRGAEDNPHKRARAERERAYMRNTWGKVIDNDPAYNQNLTLDYEDFSLR